MKRIPIFLGFLTFAANLLYSQTASHKIAIFTPLYLDSVFDINGNYVPDKTVPKFTGPGLDFYLGSKLALDSLGKRNAPLEVFFYDTRSKEPLSQQLARPELGSVELIIAESNLPETRALASFAQQKKIPFISATLPNDCGITNNPYFVMLNGSLQTHAQAIYKYLQKFYNGYKVTVFRKPGAQEDQLRKDFEEYARSATGAPVNLNFVDLGTNFSNNALAAYLDSTKKNLCVAGSLDGEFGTRLIQGLAALNKAYPVTLIGMPTWDNINLLRGPASGIEIIYTSSFFYTNSNALQNEVISYFNNALNARPSETYFKGFEATLRFALLLLETQKDLASNLTRKGNTVITQMDIEPVLKNKKTMGLDYFENKHVYFIKVFGGVKNILY